MSKKNQHVIPIKGGWGVKGAGNDKLTVKTDIKIDSEKIAREIAKNQKSELFIHGKDGKIQRRDSYGEDPYPPKG
jgi:hypothetical protein